MSYTRCTFNKSYSIKLTSPTWGTVPVCLHGPIGARTTVTEEEGSTSSTSYRKDYYYLHVNSPHRWNRFHPHDNRAILFSHWSSAIFRHELQHLGSLYASSKSPRNILFLQSNHFVPQMWPRGVEAAWRSSCVDTSLSSWGSIGGSFGR